MINHNWLFTHASNLVFPLTIIIKKHTPDLKEKGTGPTAEQVTQLYVLFGVSEGSTDVISGRPSAPHSSNFQVTDFRCQDVEINFTI